MGFSSAIHPQGAVGHNRCVADHTLWFPFDEQVLLSHKLGRNAASKSSGSGQGSPQNI
jgi:hypothetical protein